MRVHVLHHGRCFDGAASAAMFVALLRAHRGASFEAVYLPKHHQRGDPFDASDFAGADASAVVDFRYSQREELTWYFDHHYSAFQLPGDREHFEADRSGRKFHDPTAPSCAGYIAHIGAQNFGLELEAHAELIHCAETLDTADFSGPEEAVLYREPAMQLAAWIQAADDPEAISAFIDELLVTPFAKLASAKWIRERVETRLDAHWRDIELIRRVGQVGGGVFVYDLLDHSPRLLSHFIPYYLAPEVHYSVGMYAHPDGDLRLSVGFNPWSGATRSHDLAALCERHGGGGHPYVAGASFPAGQLDELRAAGAAIRARLQRS